MLIVQCNISACMDNAGIESVARRGFAAMVDTNDTRAEASAGLPAKAKPARKSLAKGAARVAARPAAKRAIAKPEAKVRAPAVVKPPKAVRPIATQSPLTAQPKEIPMETTSNFKGAVEGAQEKAKEAFVKTSAAVGEYGEFAKGNVEAFVESGKILAAGLQDMSGRFLTDGKAAFETAVADVKELSGVKNPTDFVKLQAEVMRRNFDSAIAYGSKTSEAVLKLTNEVFAPISGRVTLAVEKIRRAA